MQGGLEKGFARHYRFAVLQKLQPPRPPSGTRGSGIQPNVVLMFVSASGQAATTSSGNGRVGCLAGCAKEALKKSVRADPSFDRLRTIGRTAPPVRPEHVEGPSRWAGRSGLKAFSDCPEPVEGSMDGRCAAPDRLLGQALPSTSSGQSENQAQGERSFIQRLPN